MVKDLPSTFVELRKKVLSNASYLAALPESELGKCVIPQALTGAQNQNPTDDPQNPSPVQNPSTWSAGPVAKKL